MQFTYDARNEKCPVPLVQLRLLLKKMVSGDMCTIQLLDKGSIQDIPKLLLKKDIQFTEHWHEKQVLELKIKIS